MGEIFNAMSERDKERRHRNLENAIATHPEGWTMHSAVHWSRGLAGARLDYWPSRQKFRWKGRTYTGDVIGFIRNRENGNDA
jgi:hypothetical protein